MKRLAQKAGRGVQQALNVSLEVANGTRHVKSIQGASVLKEQVKKTAQQSKTLNSQERKQLVDGARHLVNTGFGKNHEDNALDLYEQLTGWEVRERNTEFKSWDFIRPEDLWRDGPEEERDKGWVKSVVPLQTVENGKQTKPFFSIVGIADGICEELCSEPKKDPNVGEFEEEEEWTLRSVVIECKHRMKKAFLPPPIYDQIQAVIYCFMYNTRDAEIVQVIRNEQGEEENDPTRFKEENGKEGGNPKKGSTTITRSRISLDDPIMKHDEHWVTTILPRLRQFVEAVYSTRGSNEKRYNLLRAAATAGNGGDSTDWWSILLCECPYLMDCDTAFQREQMEQF